MDWRAKIKAFGSIKEGETLYTSNFTTVVHNSTMTAIFRSFYRESREDLLKVLESTIDDIDAKADGAGDKDIITSSILGINNLKVTYKTDEKFIGALTKLVDRLIELAK